MAGALTVAAGPGELAALAAARVVEVLAAAQGERGVAALALAGGSTPRELYRRLAAAPCRDRLDWRRVELFWGDERAVPPDDPASNYRLVRVELLDRLPVPVERVHRVPGELPAAVAAARYEAELRRVLGERPRFDLVLLGLGGDGHTASLFPGAPEPPVGALAVAARSPSPPHDRVTLTLPVLNAAATVLFLVSGAAKRSAVARARSGDPALPAARVRPAGELLFYLDRAAAGV